MMIDVVIDALWLLLETYLSILEAIYRTFVPKPMKSLSGETALVTGAGQGIGREFALQLGRLGAVVVCWDVNGNTCEKTRRDIEARGGRARHFVCDVGDRKQVARVAKQTRDELGSITFLVNNAGIMPAKPLLNYSAEDVERVFRVNVFSQFWTLFEFLPDMILHDRGHVVSMSSTAGIVGTPFLSLYCSSKFANKGMMEALLMEHRQERPNCNVKLTTVHPFTVDTGLAHNPRTRFPRLVPIVKPSECARVALEAARRDEEEVFVPRRLRMAMRVSRCFPRRAQLLAQDFLGVGVGHNEK